MPAETFSKPLETVINKKCRYEYYNYNTNKYSIESKTRICHVILDDESNYNKDVVLMVFTIRNQNGKWKIHSEGAKRQDAGATVPLKNEAVKLAKNNNWKFISIAIAGEETPPEDIISQYIVSMESYDYGNETVCDLSDTINALSSMNCPDYYRCEMNVKGTIYSFSFIKKPFFMDYLRIIDNRAYRAKTNFAYNKLKNTAKYPYNRIIFGAPGTGKSFKINRDRKILLYNDDNVDEEKLDISQYGGHERVTFHPDYSYASFVGTYKPVPCKNENDEESITYEYVPGPFMRVLTSALKSAMSDNPKPHLLIIEEINRANVAAVFGDVFQLLDRNNDGVSEYSIQTSNDMRDYLAKELDLDPSKCTNIRIPNNMFIWATMNSADQGVFPMDTAFKRRWNFEYLDINDGEDKIKRKTVTLGQGDDERKVEWNDLRVAINDFLVDECRVNEDKLLGPFFIYNGIIKEDEDIDNQAFINIFKNKVLMYLFEDAAKQKRQTLFEGVSKYNLLSSIMKEFDTKGINIFNKKISNKFTKQTGDDQ